jgi:hypothetical protein
VNVSAPPDRKPRTERPRRTPSRRPESRVRGVVPRRMVSSPLTPPRREGLAELRAAHRVGRRASEGRGSS